jgi:hypothetical protein
LGAQSAFLGGHDRVLYHLVLLRQAVADEALGQMTPEEKVQVQTVAHRGRTALLFGLVGGLILAACMYFALAPS